MTAPAGIGLARVTINTTTRRLDLALPEDVRVGELLPEVLRHAAEGAADDGERHGGWVLRRGTGAVLEQSRTLATQGVRDGELLYLVAGRTEWPELDYDDVVDAIATGARRYGRSWGAVATRRCTLAVAVAIFALGLLDVVLMSPPWGPPALAALALAAALLLGGIALARAGGDAMAGAFIASSALPYAFLGGAFIAARPGVSVRALGLPQLVDGSMALLIFGAIGYVGVVAMSRLFVAAVAAGLLGVLSGVLGYTSLTTTGVTAIVVTVGIVLMPGYPLLSIRLGRVPLPSLPQRAEELLTDTPMPRRSDVYSAVARSDEILSGLLLGVSGVTLVSAAILAHGGGAAAIALAAIASVTLLSRARLFPIARQRLPLIASGVGGLAVLALAAAIGSDTNQALFVLLAATVGAGVVVLICGLLYSRRAPSPYFRRLADFVDVLLIVALLPVTCLIIGFYSYVQNLFASIGG